MPCKWVASGRVWDTPFAMVVREASCQAQTTPPPPSKRARGTNRKTANIDQEQKHNEKRMSETVFPCQFLPVLGLMRMAWALTNCWDTITC